MLYSLTFCTLFFRKAFFASPNKNTNICISYLSLCLISGGIEEDFHLKPIHDSLYRHESLPVAAATAPVISLAHDNGGDDQSTSLLSSSPPPTVVTAVAGTCDMAFDHEMFWNTIKAAKQTASVVSCRIEGVNY